MRTLHFGLRVTDREASVAFYTALAYEVIGEVPASPLGHLTMLKLPDDEFVTLDLVHDPAGHGHEPGSGAGLGHFVVQVESMDDAVRTIAARGLRTDAVESPAPDVRTTSITDPDGRRIELVEWPAGHPDGLTAADWLH